MPPHKLRNSENESGNFTLIYVDLDDTLIPTTLRNSIYARHGLEQWRNVNTISLQNSIIKSIENIKKTIIKYSPDEHIQFCVITMANAKWIDDMLFPENSIEFSTLGTYFKDHKISIISAKQHTNKYLCDTLGETEANKLINSTFIQQPEMYKYNVFSQQIKKYENKLNMKCKQIISIGDGKCEQKAIKMCAENRDIFVMNICFQSAPTMSQLHSEWMYLTKYFDKMIEKHINGIDKYSEVNVNKMLQETNVKNGNDIVGVISTLYSGFVFITKFL